MSQMTKDFSGPRTLIFVILSLFSINQVDEPQQHFQFNFRIFINHATNSPLNKYTNFIYSRKCNKIKVLHNSDKNTLSLPSDTSFFSKKQYSALVN